jgi:hypothetical protein
MRRIDCAELVALAPELAIGNLCGDERAAAIVHLAACPSCQEVVNSITAVTDRLLLVAPRAEPPAGFEERVMAALPFEVATPRFARRRHRRWALLAAAAALLIAFFAGGMLLDVGSDGPAFAGADMRTATGETVGRVVLRDGDPGTLYMTLPGWVDQIGQLGASKADYAVRIETDDGDVITQPVTLADDASWASTLDIDPDSVTSVAVVGPDGYIWCEATFRPDIEQV